ncbi:MAG: asparagine synthetase B [bacterium]
MMARNRAEGIRLALLTLLLLGAAAGRARAQHLLLPMDLEQTDHLKAYGVVFDVLGRERGAEWLLNYRGGSFLLPDGPVTRQELRLRGVAYEPVDGAAREEIEEQVAESNMETVRLEEAPRIAVYTPPTSRPWDDAVTLALTYAEIPYEKVWDPDLLAGRLGEFDWLHLHHEDFTGQFSKFYALYRGRDWYREDVARQESEAARLGFDRVADLKLAAAKAIRSWVEEGGFLFAMCLAPETLDIALAAEGVDIVPPEIDGTPRLPDASAHLDFEKTFAFTDFQLLPDISVPAFSDIDAVQVNTPRRARVLDFTLFDFSAKYDPVPSMLVQNHAAYVKGFYGLSTSWPEKRVKEHVVILGEVPEAGRVRYLHGNLGKGTFTFLGGHDPEDPEHLVEDPPTELSLHRNSPGYRLILNNVLFPAAEKKPHKT